MARGKNIYAYMTDPNCRLCDGTGEVPGAPWRPNSAPCSCRAKVECVKKTTYHNALKKLEDADGAIEALRMALSNAGVAAALVDEIEQEGRRRVQEKRANEKLRQPFLYGGKKVKA